MEALKHTKPFNLEHAKAGAPFVTARGTKVQILKWDAKGGTCPLVGLLGENEDVMRWACDGEVAAFGAPDWSLVMTPLGYIDGKPVFTGDEVFDEAHGMVAKVHPTKRDFAGCRWPEPEKKYPVTGMSRHELYLASNVAGDFETCYRAIANAALRHAVDNGYLRLPEDRAARDMAIAEVVRAECAMISAKRQEGFSWDEIMGLDLAAIIATVKEQA